MSMISLSMAWDQLSAGFNEVFDGQRINPERFLTNYTLIYNYCSYDDQDQNPRPAYSHIPFNSRKGRLYASIKRYLWVKIGKAYQKIANKDGIELIEFYLKQWKEYSRAFRLIDGMAMCLNKWWVQKYKDWKCGTLQYIKELCLSIWRIRVFDRLSDRLFGEMAKIVISELEGSPVDQESIRTLIDSFVELRLKRIDLIRGVPVQTGDIIRQEYMNKLQAVYIEHSEKVYIQISDRLLSSTDFSDHIGPVNNFLNHEIQRFNRHFGSEENPSFLALLSKVFVDRHLKLYKENTLSLIEQGARENIYTLYKICIRSTVAMVVVKTIEHQYLEDLAKKYAKDQRGLMEEIMSGKAFSFIEAHRKVFTGDVKCHPPQIFGEISSKIAVLAARHYDYLLKNTKIVDTELDTQRQAMLAIVNYIDDKDTFQRTYSKLFERRLLDGSSVSQAAEKVLVIHWRDLCGLEYANRLQKMLGDIESSKDLTDQFNVVCKSDHAGLEIDFSAAILSSLNWHTMSPIEIQIPSVLQERVNHFMRFYEEKHHSRKLIWVHSHSQGELFTNCFKKSYVLQTWTLQLAVLMLYNHVEAPSISLQVIIDRLKVNKETILPILRSLLKAEILKGGLDNNTEYIDETTEFYLNSNYMSKRKKVDLTRMQMVSESKKEAQRNQELIEMDRRMRIEACVVRIMKTRKRLAHNELISEVITQLSPSFTPNMSKIQMAIENLIERSFLKRNEESMNIYEYNAFFN